MLVSPARLILAWHIIPSNKIVTMLMKIRNLGTRAEGAESSPAEKTHNNSQRHMNSYANLRHYATNRKVADSIPDEVNF
jgi:Tfp pilus assembly major pilin PilA